MSLHSTCHFHTTLKSPLDTQRRRAPSLQRHLFMAVMEKLHPPTAWTPLLETLRRSTISPAELFFQPPAWASPSGSRPQPETPAGTEGGAPDSCQTSFPDHTITESVAGTTRLHSLKYQYSVLPISGISFSGIFA
jgi:hypothetical protein